jgi:hypothetical protein
MNDRHVKVVSSDEHLDTNRSRIPETSAAAAAVGVLASELPENQPGVVAHDARRYQLELSVVLVPLCRLFSNELV